MNGCRFRTDDGAIFVSWFAVSRESLARGGLPIIMG